MQNMSPDEREAMIARLRERGIDPNNPGAVGGRGAGGRGAGSKEQKSGRSEQAATLAGHEGGATTIDALFAPLPRTESFGRAWISVDNQLRPVRLRLGITDGQNTEIIDGDVQEGAAVVTNVVIAGQSTRPATTAFPGFGGGRQGFPGGGFQGGGGGNRGGGAGR